MRDNGKIVELGLTDADTQILGLTETDSSYLSRLNPEQAREKLGSYVTVLKNSKAIPETEADSLTRKIGFVPAPGIEETIQKPSKNNGKRPAIDMYPGVSVFDTQYVGQRSDYPAVFSAEIPQEIKSVYEQAVDVYLDKHPKRPVALAHQAGMSKVKVYLNSINMANQLWPLVNQ